MHPYRDTYIPAPVNIPAKTPSDIISLAGKAIDHFNNSCPSGITLINTNIPVPARGVLATPHGERATMNLMDSKFVTPVEFWKCCPEQRQALKDLNQLNWFYRLVAKHRFRNKFVTFQLIREDWELMCLLIPKFSAKYLDYIAKVKYNMPRTINSLMKYNHLHTKNFGLTLSNYERFMKDEISYEEAHHLSRCGQCRTESTGPK